MSRPPKTYEDFIARFPKLGEAWELLALAGQEGPLDERTQRLLKLAIAAGAQKESAVKSSVRKARDLGISDAELEQVVALAAGTLGLPAAVAAWSWMRDARPRD